jgi:hypothetical protein
MDDYALREESDSGSEVESTGRDAEGALDAAGDVWQAWVLAAVAVIAAGYFHLNEGVWTTGAEIFYALLFAIAAAVALGYGVYEVNERTSPV